MKISTKGYVFSAICAALSVLSVFLVFVALHRHQSLSAVWSLVNAVAGAALSVAIFIQSGRFKRLGD